MEKRAAKRKEIGIIDFSELTSLESYTVIASSGFVVDASSTGLLIQINRDDIVDADIKSHLNLDTLMGQPVALFLPQMSLDLDGYIVRTSHKGKGQFQIAIEFGGSIPEYWRECLIELLPNEFDINEFDLH